MKKRPEPLAGKRYFAGYTLLFAVMAVLVFFPFIRNGRSFVNKTDGMTQYLVYLRYMGQYLRSCIQRICSGSFSFPAYDFSIGLGDDIGQIVRFHPLDFLSVIVPARYTEQLYAAILFLRLYLSGLAFSVFAFYWHRHTESGVLPVKEASGCISRVNVLSGAMVYIFGGYVLLRVVNHPTYMAPFIVFPLLLSGAERVMRNEGMRLFPAMVFFGFWSNYYFMYIMSWGLLVYVMVRFFQLHPAQAEGSGRVRAFFSLAGRMILLYLLGLCMSFATLLPTILRYTRSVRASSAQAADMLVYADKRRYFAWILNLISPYQSSGNGLNLNFAVIVFPCLVTLFLLPRKKHRALKIFLIAAVLVLMVPALGYVLAVFNRENSRWMFLIALCLGMCVVLAADHLSGISGKQWRILAGSVLFYLLAAAVYVAVSGWNRYVIAGAVQLCICLIVIGIARSLDVRAMRICVLAVTCASACVNGFLSYAPSFGGAVNAYYYAGKTISKYQKNWRNKAAARIDDPTFYRIDAYGVKHLMDNCAEFGDFNGTSEYNSILNASMIDAMKTVNNKDMNAITTMHGLDARPVLLNLAHVRYFVARAGGMDAVPYGFVEEPAYSRSKTKVYRNQHPLAFGFSCGSFITRKNLMKLDPLEREMIQLHAAIVEDGDAAGDGQGSRADTLRAAGLKEITSWESGMQTETAQPSAFENAEYADGMLRIARAEGSFEIEAQKRAGYDCYISFDGLRADRPITSVRVEDGTFSGKMWIRNESELYHMGRENYLFHIGYSQEDAPRRLRIVFRYKGSYRLSGVRVLYVPVAGYDEAIDRLNRESMQAENITDGRAEGTIHLSRPGLVVFSIPYAEGWTLTVDGKEAALEKADIMYLSALLDAGDHTIRLTYGTPGQTAGCAVAAAAILVWLFLAYRGRRVEKKEVHVVDLSSTAGSRE